MRPASAAASTAAVAASMCAFEVALERLGASTGNSASKKIGGRLAQTFHSFPGILSFRGVKVH